MVSADVVVIVHGGVRVDCIEVEDRRDVEIVQILLILDSIQLNLLASCAPMQMTNRNPT